MTKLLISKISHSQTWVRGTNPTDVALLFNIVSRRMVTSRMTTESVGHPSDLNGVVRWSVNRKRRIIGRLMKNTKVNIN